MTARTNRHRIAISRATPSNTGGGGRGREEPSEEAVCLGRKRNGAGSNGPAWAVSGARQLA
jgi:hypothetical protein